MLNLDLRSRNRRARSPGKSSFRIGGDSQQDVAAIRADRQDGSRVRPGGHGNVAKNFPNLVELRQIDHRGRGGCCIDGNVAAAALEHERDRKYFHADLQLMDRNRALFQFSIPAP